jgi:hypothetical protein
MTIDGEALVTGKDEDDQKFVEDLINYADSVNEPPREDGLEKRETVLASAIANGALVITDDNMVPEWRKVLRFQEPPQ